MLTTRRDVRHALLFRLAFASKPMSGPAGRRNLPSFDLTTVIDALREARNNGKAIRYYLSDGRPYDGTSPDQTMSQVSLEDVVENTDSKGKLHSYTLRFSYVNPKAANPGKKNLTSGQRQILSIGPGEGGDVGCHLAIGLVETQGERAGFARCALEQMPGLSRAKIMALIETVADQYVPNDKRPTYHYEVKRKKGQPKQILTDSTRLRLRDFPEKSESLEEDLEHGKLKGVQFLGAPKQTDNMPNGLSDVAQVIVAKVEDEYSTGKKAKALIAEIMSFAKSKKQRAKLEIEREKEKEQQPRHKTRELDLDKQGLSDQLFSRQEPISAASDLPECYQQTNDAVRQALMGLIDRQEFWT